MDIRRIEVLDEAMAAVLRRKTPAQRLAIGFGRTRSTAAGLCGLVCCARPNLMRRPSHRRRTSSSRRWDDRMSYGDYVERITSISQGCQQGISTGRPA